MKMSARPRFKLGDEFVTSTELGRRVGLSSTSVLRRLRAGELPEQLTSRQTRKIKVGEIHSGFLVLANNGGGHEKTIRRYHLRCVKCGSLKQSNTLYYGCKHCSASTSTKVVVHGETLTLREACVLYNVSFDSTYEYSRRRKIPALAALYHLLYSRLALTKRRNKQ